MSTIAFNPKTVITELVEGFSTLVRPYVAYVSDLDAQARNTGFGLAHKIIKANYADRDDEFLRAMHEIRSERGLVNSVLDSLVRLKFGLTSKVEIDDSTHFDELETEQGRSRVALSDIWKEIKRKFPSFEAPRKNPETFGELVDLVYVKATQ